MIETIAVTVAIGGASVAGALAYASRRPDLFRVERSLRIDAPAERVFGLISNLRRMNEWNPFMKSDPNLVVSYSGPEAGTGAAQAWDGNRNAGRDRIEIVETTANRRIAMTLDMSRPCACHNRVEFTLQREEGGTTVTWAMTGRNTLMTKLVGMLCNMDRMVGAQFEKGLADLKAQAEHSARPGNAGGGDV